MLKLDLYVFYIVYVCIYIYTYMYISSSFSWQGADCQWSQERTWFRGDSDFAVMGPYGLMPRKATQLNKRERGF